MTKHKFSLIGYLMILASAALIGSYGVWSRVIGGDFGIFYQGWVRSAIILILMIPIIILTKSYKKIEKADRKWILITVLFGVMTQVPIYYAFVHSNIGTTIVIFYATFVITAYLVGRLFLGEKITTVKMVSMLLALAGLSLTFGLSLSKFSFIALGLAALNGIASGGEVSSSKRSSDRYSSLMITFWVWLATFLTHLPLSLVTHEKQWAPALDKNWAAMLAYALAGLLGFWLVIEGFKFVDASIGSLVGLTEVIFAVIYGYIIFTEPLTFSVIAGGALIIVAAMLPDLLNIIKHRKTRLPVEPIHGI